MNIDINDLINMLKSDLIPLESDFISDILEINKNDTNFLQSLNDQATFDVFGINFNTFYNDIKLENINEYIQLLKSDLDSNSLSLNDNKVCLLLKKKFHINIYLYCDDLSHHL